MKKTIKWIVIAIVVLVILVIVTPLALVVFIDPNDYKDDVIQTVKTHTGRNLKIPGDLHWSLNWRLNLAVELGELELGNAPGFGTEPFARIKNAAVAVEVLPLLSGEAKLGAVTLDGLFLNLQRDKQGRTNWSDLMAAEAEAPAKPDKPTEEKPPTAAAFAVGGLAIRDAEIRWQDQQQNRSQTLKDFTLESGAIAPGETFPLQLGFTFDSSEPAFRLQTELNAEANVDTTTQRFQLAALESTQNFSGKAIPGDRLTTTLGAKTLRADLADNYYQLKGAELGLKGAALKADFESGGKLGDAMRGLLALSITDGTALAKQLQRDDLKLAVLDGSVINIPVEGDLDKQIIKLHDITLRGALLNVDSKLTVTQAMDAPRVDGTLRIAEFSPRQVMSKLGMPVPVTADPQVLQKLGLQSQVSANVSDTVTTVALNDVKLMLDDTRITGTLGIADLNKQAMRFDLDVDKLNADRYLPPEAKDGEKPDQPANTAGKPGAAGKEEPLPVDGIRGLDVDGKLRVGALQLMKVKMTTVVANVVARDDKLTLDPLKFQLYDGGFTGAAVINAKPKTPTFAANTAANNVNLGPLVKDLTGKEDLTGKGKVNFSLTAKGNTVSEVKQYLNGNAGFALNKGTVTLVDTDALAKYAMAKVTKQPLPPRETLFRSSPYEVMSGTAKIVNGVINNNDLLVKSANADVKGEGKVDIAREMMHYKTTIIYGQTKNGRYKELEGLPIVVTFTGPFTDLRKDFDVDGFAKAWFKREAKQKVKEEQKKLEEKYKEKLDKKIEDKLKDIFR
jgi:AsmA protein